jgi:hypothetical protein
MMMSNANQIRQKQTPENFSGVYFCGKNSTLLDTPLAVFIPCEPFSEMITLTVFAQEV